jgi:hypothetical protein
MGLVEVGVAILFLPKSRLLGQWAMSFVCRLLAVALSFGLSPAHEVPPFVLLVVLGVSLSVVAYVPLG